MKLFFWLFCVLKDKSSFLVYLKTPVVPWMYPFQFIMLTIRNVSLHSTLIKRLSPDSITPDYPQQVAVALVGASLLCKKIYVISWLDNLVVKVFPFFFRFSQLSRSIMVVLVYFKSWTVYLLLEYKLCWLLMGKLSKLVVLLLVGRKSFWCYVGLGRLNNTMILFLLAIQAGFSFVFSCNNSSLFCMQYLW